MSAMMGPGPDPAAMGLMEEMLAGGDVPFSSSGGSVVCQACQLPIDPATGEPLQPPTQSNVDAVRRYMTDAGAAEMGGVQLETPSGSLVGG